MEVVKKAIELINLHGFEVANKICDSMITEFQEDWNQEKIDFYLDVKLEMDKINKNV